MLFALDSIPAIFGLTKEPYLVFAANAFALMGLRQLYFLTGGLLQRLVYLSLGLSVVLALISVKLVLEALHGNGVSWAPEIGIAVSLSIIIGAGSGPLGARCSRWCPPGHRAPQRQVPARVSSAGRAQAAGAGRSPRR